MYFLLCHKRFNLMRWWRCLEHEKQSTIEVVWFYPQTSPSRCSHIFICALWTASEGLRYFLRLRRGSWSWTMRKQRCAHKWRVRHRWFVRFNFLNMCPSYPQIQMYCVNFWTYNLFVVTQYPQQSKFITMAKGFQMPKRCPPQEHSGKNLGSKILARCCLKKRSSNPFVWKYSARWLMSFFSSRAINGSK